MIVYRLCVALVRALLPLQMRLRVVGAERCPRSGPLILVCNHLGPLDPAPVAVAVPRPIRILAKAEIYGWPVLGLIARLAKIVPVRRGESDRAPLRLAEAALGEGSCILLWPESTYAKPPLPAGMLPFKPGVGFLALRSGAVVLPLALTGCERVWTPERGWRPWHRPQVTLTFGEPYRPGIPPGMSTKAAYQAVTDEMARRIAALLPPEYHGVYAEEVLVCPSSSSSQ